MTFHLKRIAAIAAFAGLAAACTQPAPTPGASAAATPTVGYEAVSLTGSPQENGGLLRINITTGETVLAWDDKPVTITFLETSPPPTGHYRVYAWSTIMQANGQLVWNAIRMDEVSGRLWRLAGDGGTTPFSWSEYTAPPKA
ncbi:MAG TPA: hypothetical protein VII42_07385 [Caulobacteraceae bacterium]